MQSMVHLVPLLTQVAILWIIGTSAVSANSLPTTYSLGGLFTITDSGLPYSYANPQPLSAYDCYYTAANCSGPSEWGSFLWQLQQINANPNILPNTTLTIDMRDDQDSSSSAFFKAYEVLNDGNTMMAGTDSSSPAKSAALVAQGFQAPMISYGASSPDLANKKLYPYFMRVCQNDAGQGEALAWFSKYYFNWNHVALLYSTDSYGSGGSVKFLEAASRFNLSIRIQQSFDLLASIEDFELPLQRIKDSGARIIVYFGQNAEFANAVFKANELNMFNNETVWLVSDTIYSAIPAIKATAEQLQQRLTTTGLIALIPDSGLGTPAFTEMANSFVNRPLPPGTHVFDSYTPTSPAAISHYVAFTIDTVTVMANALHDLLYVQGIYNFTQSQLFSTLKKTDLVGVSGRIQFDSNLDRIGIRYILNNLQADLNWHRIAIFDGNSVSPIAGAGPVLFHDGTATVPISEALPVPPPPPPNSILSTSSSNGLIIVACIFLGVIILNILGIRLHKTSRVIHAASPSMLLIVLLGGGLVMSAVIISGLDQSLERCTVREWLFNIGFQLSFGAILLKTYRVHMIFNNSKLQVTNLNDTYLFKILAIFISFDILILSLRTGLAPYELDQYQVCSFESGNQSNSATILTLILVVSKGLMILSGAYLSFAVRNLPQLYNESTYLGIAIYNTLLIGAAWIGVRYGVDLTQYPASVTLFESALMLASTGLTLGLIFAPKWYDVFQAARENALLEGFRSPRNKRGGTMTGGGSLHYNPNDVGLTNLSKTQLSALDDQDNTVSGSIPSSELDVERLLETVLQEQTKQVERTCKEIEQNTHKNLEKKKDLAKFTDTIFQVQCELDFFREVGKTMTKDEIALLFKRRLKQFHALPESRQTDGRKQTKQNTTVGSHFAAAIQQSLEHSAAKEANSSSNGPMSGGIGSASAYDTLGSPSFRKPSTAPPSSPSTPDMGIRPYPQMLNPNQRSPAQTKSSLTNMNSGSSSSNQPSSIMPMNQVQPEGSNQEQSSNNSSSHGSGETEPQQIHIHISTITPDESIQPQVQPTTN